MKYEFQWCKLKLTEKMYLSEVLNFTYIFSNFSCSLPFVQAIREMAELGVFKRLDTSNITHVEFVGSGILARVQKIANGMGYDVDTDDLSTFRALLPYVISEFVKDEFYFGSK